jgi:peptidase E
MSDVSVNSVQPSEVGKEMVAYLLTASILCGAEYEVGYHDINGLPLINGKSRDEILRTYALALNVVKNPAHAKKWIDATGSTTD